MRIGLISDTHGLLRPEAIAFLRGCAHIVHAGDIGSRRVLDELSALAPTTAVRGNNDQGEWAAALPETTRLQLGKVSVYVIHDLSGLYIDPQAEGVDVVISGHSHRPLVREHHGVLYINPGSAGPRRFKLPIAVGELIIASRSVSPRIVELVKVTRASDRGGLHDTRGR
jgi:putative phosphoesterase